MTRLLNHHPSIVKSLIVGVGLTTRTPEICTKDVLDYTSQSIGRTSEGGCQVSSFFLGRLQAGSHIACLASAVDFRI